MKDGVLDPGRRTAIGEGIELAFVLARVLRGLVEQICLGLAQHDLFGSDVDDHEVLGEGDGSVVGAADDLEERIHGVVVEVVGHKDMPSNLVALDIVVIRGGRSAPQRIYQLLDLIRNQVVRKEQSPLPKPEEGLEALELDHTAIYQAIAERDAMLREQAPVWQDPVTGFFVITRFEDLRAILLDTTDYLNSMSGGQGGSRQRLDQDRANRMHQLYKDKGWVPAPTLAGRDDPNHKQMRAMFNEAFRPKKINAMDPFVRDTAYKLIDAINIVPTSFTFALFPLMSRYAHESRSAPEAQTAMNRAYLLAVRLLVLVSLPLAMTLTCLAYKNPQGISSL